MNKYTFEVRFFNYNFLLKQFEYLVECASLKSAFLIGVSENFTNFVKISDIHDPSPSVQYIVSKITSKTGRENFEKAFFEAIKDGFDNINQAGFNFKIGQSITDRSHFKFLETIKVYTKYTNQVNGSPYQKIFSTDLGAVIAESKFVWLQNIIDIEDEWEYPTQLNVDVLYDEEDDKKLFYIELETEGHWYDATTFESGKSVEQYFNQYIPDYKKAISNLSKYIGLSFEAEWESIYTKEGEILNRLDYEHNRSN